MSQRYLPSGTDSRFPRGRSPPRFGDRRTSVPHGAFQGRNTDSSYRPGDDSPREPPRGPKGGLYNESSRGSPFTPRGRGSFPSRGRGYDSFSRRDSERSWSERRDTYDEGRRSPTGRRSPIGRGRSRSPQFRDSRDTRDPPDSARTFDSPSDRVRGGYGGRGRGGFERGSRGRPFGSQDRDRFRARSRSRDRFPEDPREDRFDRDLRRDDDRWDRGREANRRDGPPLRPESRVLDDHARTTSPSAASTASGQYGRNQAADSHPKAIAETSRRSSLPASARPGIRTKDEPRPSQPVAHPPSSPPQAPSVPAYGSDAALLSDARKPSAIVTNAKATSENGKLSATSPGGSLSNVPTGPRAEGPSDPLKVAPKGPKADLAKGPIPPPVRRSMSNTMPPGRLFERDEPRPGGPSGSPQIPSGPRALTGRSTALEPSFNQALPSSSFPAVPPRGIPTGPKNMNMPPAMNILPAVNMPPTSNANVWVRPGARQPAAGTASAESHKSDSFNEGRPRPSSAGNQKPVADEAMQVEPVVKAEKATEERESLPEPLSAHAMDVDRVEDEARPVSDQIEQVPESDFALPQSDDDDAVSDDGMSEEDLQAQMAKFEREREQLEGKRPLPNTDDNELLLMLDELDAFAEALKDHQDGLWPLPKREEPEQPDVLRERLQGIPPLQSPNGLPTPPSAQQMESVEDLSDEDEDLESGLPFKRTSPPTPMSQLSVLKDEAVSNTVHREQMLQSLAVRTKSEQGDADLLRQEFSGYFWPWRVETDKLEKQRQAEDEAAAAADASTDQPEATSATTPALETTRGGRRGFMTQLELDQALALSRQTHAEEQARAKEVERETLTVPDMNKECIIPDMLNIRMQEHNLYKDSNNRVEHETALDIFKFIPPEDDFTEEENELFKKAYEKNARKQWGHIASDIPGRTYKDCIMHYYLTKRQEKYKKLLQKKAAGRKGPRGKGKTNALLSDLAARPDGDGTGKVEVTDTGRPKRAAAPTNFDRRVQQEVDTAPQRGKGKSKTTAKVADGLDGASDKPSRGRGGGKERGTRRGRGAGGIGSGPARKIAATETAPEMPSEEATRPSTTMMEDARLLTEFSSSTNASMIPGAHTENWLNPQPVSFQPQLAQSRAPPPLAREEPEQHAPIGTSDQSPFSIRGERVGQPPVQPRPEPDPPQQQADPISTPSSSKRGGSSAGSRNNPSSSYWSVAEQNQVQTWAAILGSNWDAYAARMKSKSAVMVRNHVARLTADGKNPQLAEDIVRADAENERDPERIDTMTAERKIDSPLGHETTTSLQRPIAPGRAHSREVKQEREAKEKPARARADSHIAVAPKPVAGQSGSLEASPARPRNKSNASTKSNIMPQQQQQQQQPGPQTHTNFQQSHHPQPTHSGPQAGYFDVSKPKDKAPPAHSAEPRHESRPAPVPPSAIPESRPTSGKWTIDKGFVRRDNTISTNYTTITGASGSTNEARQVAVQQPSYAQAPAHGSPYMHAEERPPIANAPIRHEIEHTRAPQVAVTHPQDERSARMPIHGEPGGPVYQRSQQPLYSYSQDSQRPAQPPASMGSLLRDDQPRPSSAIAGGGYGGPGGSSILHGHSASSAPTPVQQAAFAPVPAPAAPKRSNIMDILNSGDSEPAPKRITTSSRAPAPVPTPPPSQNTVPPPPYQSIGQSQYSSRPPVQQQYSSYAESPYGRRDTPPDPRGVQQHPSQHPSAPSPYEPQRQTHPSSHLQQHHYNQAPPSHLSHEHGRNWPPPSQHSYPPPEQPRFSSFTSHASPQPTRPSFAPPPPSHSQYAASTAPQYRAPSPAHHSRGPTGPRPPEHGGLPPSVYSRGGGPPSSMSVGGPPSSLLSRPPSTSFGSPLSQEQMRMTEDRQRRGEPPGPGGPGQGPGGPGMYGAPPQQSRDGYPGTPHGYRPPPHYQQQPPPR